MRRVLHVDWQPLADTLVRLAKRVAGELRAGNCVGTTVTVKLRYADFETHAHGKALERRARFPLYKKVRLIGVRVGGLRRSAA